MEEDGGHPAMVPLPGQNAVQDAKTPTKNANRPFVEVVEIGSSPVTHVERLEVRDLSESAGSEEEAPDPPPEAALIGVGRDEREFGERPDGYDAVRAGGQHVQARERQYSQEAPYKRERWEGRPAWMRTIWIMLEEPDSSTFALASSVFVTVVIGVAITSFVVETHPQYYGRKASPFPEIEYFCTFVFTVEVALRLTCCPSLWNFCLDPWNVCDMVAVLPFYLERLAGLFHTQQNQRGMSFALVRVVRLFRLAKLIRYGKRSKQVGGMLNVFRDTMIQSWDNMKMMIFFELLTMVICGASVYHIERGVYSEDREEWLITQQFINAPPPFDAPPAEAVAAIGTHEVVSETMFVNVPAGMYWTLVTVTGVGYGEMVPITVVGKFATFITILAGLLLIALPVSVIGGNFQRVYMQLISREVHERAFRTAAGSAFALSGLRFRLRSHRKALRDLQKKCPGRGSAENAGAAGVGASSPSAAIELTPRRTVRRASQDIPSLEDSVTSDAASGGAKAGELGEDGLPTKKFGSRDKVISLDGVRSSSQLAQRLAPKDFCAKLYMEHVLRVVRMSDEHFEEAIHDVVSNLYVDVLEHTQKHVVEGYEDDREVWDREMWKERGRGLPDDFESHDSPRGQHATAGRQVEQWGDVSPSKRKAATRESGTVDGEGGGLHGAPLAGTSPPVAIKARRRLSAEEREERLRREKEEKAAGTQEEFVGGARDSALDRWVAIAAAVAAAPPRTPPRSRSSLRRGPGFLSDSDHQLTLPWSSRCRWTLSGARR